MHYILADSGSLVFVIISFSCDNVLYINSLLAVHLVLVWETCRHRFGFPANGGCDVDVQENTKYLTVNVSVLSAKAEWALLKRRRRHFFSVFPV